MSGIRRFKTDSFVFRRYVPYNFPDLAFFVIPTSLFMETEIKSPSKRRQTFIVLATFAASALLTYGTGAVTKGYFGSTPYQNPNAVADQTLDRLTGGQGREILDGLVARVKQKAEEKGGNPLNVTDYNAYLDDYLAKMDQMDNSTRASLGSGYEFLFQYLYPRVYGLRLNAAVANAGTARGTARGTANVISPIGTKETSSDAQPAILANTPRIPVTVTSDKASVVLGPDAQINLTVSGIPA